MSAHSAATAIHAVTPAMTSMPGEATFLSISAGDWLQAVSGIVGVGLTVLVTLWIEGRRRRAEERADLKIVETAVRDLQGALDACDAALPADLAFDARLAAASAAQKQLYEAHPGYEFARAQTVVRDLAVFRELRYLDSALAGTAAQIGSEYNILMGGAGRVTEAVLRVNQAKIGEIVDYLRPFANRAAETLQTRL